MPDLDMVVSFEGTADIYKIVSASRPGIVHTVEVYSERIKCSCEGFQYRQHCKHEQAYRQGDFPQGHFDLPDTDFEVSL